MIKHTSKFSFFFVICCGFLAAAPAWAQQRMWTDDTGSNRVEAELIAIEKAVRLKKKNGVVITVPYSRLSAADIAFLDNLEAIPTAESSNTNSQPPANGLASTKNGSDFPSTENLTEASPAVVETDANPADPSQPDKSPTASENPPGNNPAILNERPAVKTVRLSEPQLQVIRQTLANLKSDWPANPEPELLEQLASYSEANDKLIRGDALALLGEHNPENNLELIFRWLDDSSFEIRWQAYDILEAVSDRRAIEPLIARYSGRDCSRISSVLQVFGSEIEPKIIPFLDDPSADVRLSACDLLGRIGTNASIPALQEMRENAIELAVRVQAQYALKEIARRQ